MSSLLELTHCVFENCTLLVARFYSRIHAAQDSRENEWDTERAGINKEWLERFASEVYPEREGGVRRVVEEGERKGIRERFDLVW